MTQGLTLFLFGVNSDACTIFQPYFNWKYLLYLLIFGKRRVSKGLFSGSAGKRICLQCRRPWFNSWVGKIHWRRDRLPSPRFLDFPGGSAAKESTCNVGEMFSSVALFTFPTERLQLLFEANIFTPGK